MKRMFLTIAIAIGAFLGFSLQANAEYSVLIEGGAEGYIDESTQTIVILCSGQGTCVTITGNGEGGVIIAVPDWEVEWEVYSATINGESPVEGDQMLPNGEYVIEWQ